MAELLSSPGYAQAAFLRVLADHLDRWDVGVVNVSSDHGGGWLLHVLPTRDASVGLAGWARSLGVAELEVRALAEQVNVGFAASIGGGSVRVWGCVDPLREAMNLTVPQYGGVAPAAVIGVAALGYFGVHGALPAGGGS